jgi:hypothetical protein
VSTSASAAIVDVAFGRLEQAKVKLHAFPDRLEELAEREGPQARWIRAHLLEMTRELLLVHCGHFT